MGESLGRRLAADYFETLHIPLLRGREFTPADEKNQSTMIINEAMARKFWPEADPIGKTLLNRDYRNPLVIIGIVGDVRGAGLNAQAKLEMYTPLRDSGTRFSCYGQSGDHRKWLPRFAKKSPRSTVASPRIRWRRWTSF